jgi:hypothetical protein
VSRNGDVAKAAVGHTSASAIIRTSTRIKAWSAGRGGMTVLAIAVPVCRPHTTRALIALLYVSQLYLLAAVAV